MSNFSAKRVITVTYNDDTDTAGKIDYTATTRTTHAGATMLGWSNSTDGGKTWKYGGTVAPPRGWAVLWGDPAITTDFADQRYVFISNLAIPSSKMPADGIKGAVNAYLGGACIARSEDGGVTFKIHQGVSNDSDFYDGGSMPAAGSFDDRRVFAAFVNVDTNRIDVWASPSDTGTFKMMPNPFPGMTMASHPRLRFDRSTGSLYVAALDAPSAQVYIARHHAGTWGKPVLASNSTAGNPDVKLSDRSVRTAYQFSFDGGARSAGEDDNSPYEDGVRVVYTAKDGRTNKLYIRGSFCDYQLKECRDAPEWGTTPGNLNLKGQQFNPSVRAFPGLFGLSPVWKVTYMSTDDDPNGNTVSLKQGNLAGCLTEHVCSCRLISSSHRSRVLTTAVTGETTTNCSFRASTTTPPSRVFIMPHSDSTKGCTTRWTYTSKELHVSAVVFK